MSRKTIRDWFVIMLLLLFLPKDSRLTFDVRPEDWYGELRIPADEGLVVIGKNSNTERVELGLKGQVKTVSLQADQDKGVVLKDPSHGLPNSILVASAGLRENGDPARVAFMDDKYYFHPGKLSIFTQADLYYSYAFMGFIVGLFMLLGFWIARHGIEQDFEITDKTQ